MFFRFLNSTLLNPEDISFSQLGLLLGVHMLPLDLNSSMNIVNCCTTTIIVIPCAISRPDYSTLLFTQTPLTGRNKTSSVFTPGILRGNPIAYEYILLSIVFQAKVFDVHNTEIEHSHDLKVENCSESPG